MSKSKKLDLDEALEWQIALQDVLENNGKEYTQILMDAIVAHWTSLEGNVTGYQNTAYRNSLPAEQDQLLVDDDQLGQSAFHVTLWNAMAMVVRAGKVGSELGGHISTYASIGSLYQVGLDYFFKVSPLQVFTQDRF